MRIGLIDVDQKNFPNLALMKLSAFHKALGHHVEFCSLYERYDILYSSKVFTYTEEGFTTDNVIKGGAAHDLAIVLPDGIEHLCPDYALYSCDRSYGFLTRGCPNNCPWCLVPRKEGMIRAHADVQEFARHRDVVLLDNNVLASEHGIKQIERIVEFGYHVDFNQGMDARLIDNAIARLLSKVKWIKTIRLACDSQTQMKSIQKAVTLLRWNNVRPARYFVYMLVRDIDEAMERARFLKGLYLEPFAQPFIGFNGEMPTREQKDFARWVNHSAVFNSVLWEDYRYGAHRAASSHR